MEPHPPQDSGRASSRPDPSDPGPPAAAWPCRLALAATLAPFAVAAVVVAVVGARYHPWLDWAWIELQTRDVGRQVIDVGMWSREDWFHPGPALFYVMALPYRLTGESPSGLLLGAIVVNAAAVTAIAVVARRLAGPPLTLATLLGCGVLLRSFGPDFVRDPWNCTITVLPYGLLLLLTWAMTCGRSWALPAGAAVASFTAQTHVGYVPLAVPLIIWGAGWLAVLAARTRQARERAVATPVPPRALARAGVLTALILAVMWGPPLVQELRHDPGNLTAIARYFRTSDDPAHTLTDGLRVIAAQFGLPPEWVAGPRPLTVTGEPTALYTGAPVPWLLAPVALAAAVLVRRGGPVARRLVLTLGVAALLGVVSVARTVGLVYAYRLQWTPVLAMAACLLVWWAGWLVLEPHLARCRPLARRVPALALAAVAVVAAVNCVQGAGAGLPDRDRAGPGPGTPSDAIAALVPAIEAALPPGTGPVLVESVSPESWLHMFGVQASLVRDGVDARLPDVYLQVPAHRRHRGATTRAEVVVAVNEDIERLGADPALRELARWGHIPPPLTPDEPAWEMERLWGPGAVERLREIARETVGQSDRLRRPFEIHAVAAFLRTR